MVHRAPSSSSFSFHRFTPLRTGTAGALAQLEEMFPGCGARDCFVHGELHEWRNEPYIRCGYTHPRVPSLDASTPPDLASFRAFAELAKPLPNGRVMFAGEVRLPGEGNPGMEAWAMEGGEVVGGGQKSSLCRRGHHRDLIRTTPSFHHHPLPLPLPYQPIAPPHFDCPKIPPDSPIRSHASANNQPQ